MTSRWLVLAALAGLACALTPPDRPAGYGFRNPADNQVFRWEGNRVPVRFWAEAKGAVPDYVNEGIRSWEAQFLYGEFEGALVTDSARVDVKVFLAGTAPPPAALTDAPPANACSGVTSFTVSGDKITLPVTITLSVLMGFTPEQVANCLARVTIHELGHALGLMQHSDRATDIMFGAPFGPVQAKSPSVRDRATVQQLYHTTPDVRP